MKNFMHQYMRDKNNNPVGLMVAQKYDDGTIIVAGSRVNEKAGDKFDKTIAMKIAKGRLMCARDGKLEANRIADNMKTDIFKFIDRVERYFQPKDYDASILPVVSVSRYNFEKTIDKFRTTYIMGGIKRNKTEGDKL